MLTRPRDAHRNVQVWGNGLTCQAYLPVAWHPDRIHASARRPHGCAHYPGQFLQLTKGLWTSQTTPACYDNSGIFQLDPSAVMSYLTHDGNPCHGGIECDWHRHHFPLTCRVRRQRRVRLWAQRRDLRSGQTPRPRQHIATVDWPCCGEPTTGSIEFDLQAILQQTNAQATGQPWPEVAPQRCSPQENDVRRHAATQLDESRQVQLHVPFSKQGI